ncbi:bifunctional deaminase-reductase domain protein [Gemmatirosa kalamazoonensis]|uniref:Bifunctional deaminase-reductase domain protein n=1 Tax=Gemmatirosa kalamazoonensis TaxID=861299 RepID=W0RBM8_9BACT|nr:dihydrofolate reductase family protein [Gemmatirosa kalamazoonensis]AHG88181.1 bifunctional deaminase-reductase domain protein [Gemmatirosa kalamazoonensis]
MRKIIAFDRVSADGYFSTPDGKLDWTVNDEQLDRDTGGRAGEPGAGTMLFGRRTYEMFEAFWPHVLDAPTDPHHAGRSSPAIRAMAEYIDAATKIVFSKTRADVTWTNSRLLRDVDPAEVEAIKNGPGKDIMIFGSGSVVSQLSAHGLVDEYHFVVGPLLLGDGRPLVRDVGKQVRLELLEAKPYPSGNVVLRYALAR